MDDKMDTILICMGIPVTLYPILFFALHFRHNLKSFLGWTILGQSIMLALLYDLSVVFRHLPKFKIEPIIAYAIVMGIPAITALQIVIVIVTWWKHRK